MVRATAVRRPLQPKHPRVGRPGPVVEHDRRVRPQVEVTDRDRGGERHTARADALYAEADFDVVDAVRAVALERGASPAQIALAWLLGKPAVSAPVVGRPSSATSTTRSRRWACG